MRLPVKAPARLTSADAAAKSARDVASVRAAVEPAGCCAQVCLPFVGCHCVLDLPICP
jgi:hypothetical protein